MAHTWYNRRTGNYVLPDGRVVTEAERQRHRRALLMQRTPDQIVRDRNAKHPDGTKRCQKCKRPQPFHHFAYRARERDGLDPRCYSCRADHGADRA